MYWGMLFQSWRGLWTTAVLGVLGYGALIVLLRGAGKRTLSRMNAFDLVVNVSLGSLLASMLLTKDVSLAKGTVALATLIALQYGVAWVSVRSKRVRELVKSEPRLLVLRGEMLEEAMRKERVSVGEVMAAVRGQGMSGLEEVEAMVLETDGSFSVVSGGGGGRALKAVEGYGDSRDG